MEYRRGFDTFAIVVSPRLPGERLLDERSGDDPNGRDVVLTGGYLKGATGRTWLSDADFGHTQGPTLLAFVGGWKVDISGGLTRQELVEVANSLQQIHGD